MALVGLGGGGSHIAQQLAHVGIGYFRLVDADHAEISNLNRLVGATYQDAVLGAPKVAIAERLIKGVSPFADVKAYRNRWQEAARSLRDVDLVFGCVDSYSERSQLEAFARRFCIPLIDIGMDVQETDGRHYICGQVILSMPGGPCMWCMGFMNDSRLEEEASEYGQAGPRPQVVWANGILASAAVGIGVELLTGWTKESRPVQYLSYDGNRSVLTRNPRLDYLPKHCSHYSPDQTGEPIWIPVG